MSCRTGFRAGVETLGAVHRVAQSPVGGCVRQLWRTTTPAAADAWPRSSSPACPSTDPTRNASVGHGAPALAAERDKPRPARRPLRTGPRCPPCQPAHRPGPATKSARCLRVRWHRREPWLWFETVADRAGARSQAPAQGSCTHALLAGSEKGVTVHRQRRTPSGSSASPRMSSAPPRSGDRRQPSWVRTSRCRC